MPLLFGTSFQCSTTRKIKEILNSRGIDAGLGLHGIGKNVAFFATSSQKPGAKSAKSQPPFASGRLLADSARAFMASPAPLYLEVYAEFPALLRVPAPHGRGR